MSQRFELYTTLDEFDALHKEVDSHRANAKTVNVNRQTLLNILMDHSRIMKHLGIR